MKLNIEQHSSGVFDARLDLLKENNSLSTIDNSMVISQSQVPNSHQNIYFTKFHLHHGSGDNLVFNNNRSVNNGVHTEDSRLRKVDDGSTHKRSENSTVGDGEGTTSQFFRSNLVVFTSSTQIKESLFNIGKTESFAVSDDGDEETSRGSDGNGDINVVSVDNFLTILRDDFIQVSSTS